MTTHRRTILQHARRRAGRGRIHVDGGRGAAGASARAGRAGGRDEDRTPFKPKFFTPHEYATVRMLVDIVIPKDERSGSATDAGVPEFMDFIMGDEPGRQLAMRGGLAWLDRECVRTASTRRSSRARKPSARRCSMRSRGRRQATPSMSHGVAFFNSFRDLTASGFWTSKMGIKDIAYIGNVYVPEWKGCPDEALKKLGLV